MTHSECSTWAVEKPVRGGVMERASISQDVGFVVACCVVCTCEQTLLLFSFSLVLKGLIST